MTNSTGSKRRSRSSRLQRIAVLQEKDRRACAADPAWFIERHVQIEEPDGTVIPFTLWDFQRDVLMALQAGEPILVLKARRLGLSWVVLAFALWLAINRQGIRILILCKTEPDATELLDRIRRILERIRENPASAHVLIGLQQPSKERDAVTTLDVGASTIRALVGTPAAARSETAGFILLDEFAFQRRAGEIWRAILPTIEGGGNAAIVSTGNGPEQHPIGGEFAAQWHRALAGLSGIRPFFFPWMARPDRDAEWEQRTREAIGDPDRFRVEYPTEPADAFLAPDAEFVYDPAGIAAAVKLGAELDARREAGDLAPPDGGGLALGIDWGLGSTHILPAWQLAGGGIYIPPGEIVSSRGEPSDLTRRALLMAAGFDPPLVEARYDSAGAQQMATFASIAPPHIVIYAVNFGQRKKQAVGFLRELFARAAQGKDSRVIAISPQNTVLIEQLKALEQDERGEIIKQNDHGPDALIAAVCPIALAYPSSSPGQ